MSSVTAPGPWSWRRGVGTVVSWYLVHAHCAQTWKGVMCRPLRFTSFTLLCAVSLLLYGTLSYRLSELESLQCVLDSDPPLLLPPLLPKFLLIIGLHCWSGVLGWEFGNSGTSVRLVKGVEVIFCQLNFCETVRKWLKWY